MKYMFLLHPSGACFRTPVLVLAAALASMLAGCGSMAPPYEQPVLPVAHTFESQTGADAPAQEGANAALVYWRAYFTDPALQAVMGMALENNRDLRSAALRVEEARAAFNIQRSERWPTLAAQGSGDRSRVPGSLSPTGSSFVGSQYQLGVGVASWEIDFWGAVRSRSDAALQSYLATDAARRATVLSLVGQVANVVLGLRELDERLALARQTIDTRQESVRIFTRRVDVGATSRLQLTQVQTLLTQAQALASQLEQARAAQAHTLTLLVGAPVALERSAQALGAEGFGTPLAVGLSSDLLLSRPDILAAEHQLRAANANIGAARAAYFPRVALTGALGSASNELDGLLGSGSQAWSFGPTISLPIFDGGRRSANLAVTQARQALAVAAYEQSIQNAFRDVADALSNQRWLGQQLGLAQAALDVQTERARLSQLRYDSGATSYLDVLDAQRDLLTVQQQRVQVRRALLSSQVALYSALGGGSRTLASPLDAEVPQLPPARAPVAPGL